MPFAQSKSEFVFSEDLTSGELAERHDIVHRYNCESGSESNNEDDVEKVIVKPVYASDDLLHLYRSAMTLQNFVKDAPPFAPKWPPDASDITLENSLENVPIALFNSMAWILGFSEEPRLDKYVAVSHESQVKVLSLCQDIIYISSKGRKQTPKHLSLAMAVRQITGSYHTIKLLNGFGHCISHSTVLALDTTLATGNLNNPSLVHKCMQKGKFTITVWDNCDFLEETES